MAGRRRLILIYNRSWAYPDDRPLPDCNCACEFTRDRKRLLEADAVLFHVPSIRDWSGIRKRRGQKWVAASMESDVMYPQLRDPAFMARFDLTHTYHLDSDVPMFYFGPWELEALSTPPRPKTAEALVAAFISNVCEASGRYRYMTELMRHVKVDSYGKVLRNRTLPLDRGRATKLDTIARYKFTIAMENSRTLDYVSEKLYDPLIAGSIPIYLGAPNVEQFAPADHCYIHGAEFQGPRELAEYLLMLDRDEQRYAEYLAWKNRPLRPAWIELAMSQQEDPLCRLCRKLRELEAVEAAPYAVRSASESQVALIVTQSDDGDRIAAGFVRELERNGVMINDPKRPSAAALHFGPPDDVKPVAGTLNVNYTTSWAAGTPDRKLDLVIVPTESSRSAWVESGFPAESVRACAPGVDLASYIPGLTPLHLSDLKHNDIRQHGVRFLNVSEIAERNNLLGLLRVWIRNTNSSDRAVLIMKLTGETSRNAVGLMYGLHLLERELGKKLHDAAPVVFHDTVVAEKQMPRMFASATHYWSMSHGEGWDQAMLEAAACGLHLIAPDHSCYPDWLDNSTAALIPSRLGAEWWDPDEETAGRLIREAIGTGIGDGPGPARERVLAEFGWEAAGDRLAAILKRLQQEHGLNSDVAGC